MIRKSAVRWSFVGFMIAMLTFYMLSLFGIYLTDMNHMFSYTSGACAFYLAIEIFVREE